MEQANDSAIDMAAIDAQAVEDVARSVARCPFIEDGPQRLDWIRATARATWRHWICIRFGEGDFSDS